MNGSWAGESGTSSYLVGFGDFLSGILPKPGFYYRNDSFFFQGTVKAVLSEGFLETNAKIDNYANISRFNYVSPLKWIDSFWAMSLRVPVIRSHFSGRILSPIFIADACAFGMLIHK
jgi:hypothetical protein